MTEVKAGLWGTQSPAPTEDTYPGSEGWGRGEEIVEGGRGKDG